jgi:hypothetical protein
MALSTVDILTGLGFSSISISFRAHIRVAANRIANFLSSVMGDSALGYAVEVETELYLKEGETLRRHCAHQSRARSGEPDRRMFVLRQGKKNDFPPPAAPPLSRNSCSGFWSEAAHLFAIVDQTNRTCATKKDCSSKEKFDRAFCFYVSLFGFQHALLSSSGTSAGGESEKVTTSVSVAHPN